MSLNEFLAQYATSQSKIPRMELDPRQYYATSWLTQWFGPEFVELISDHTRQVSDHEVWIIRDHCPGDLSFALIYNPDHQLIHVHRVEEDYKSQAYSEFVVDPEPQGNLQLLADALQQLTEEIKHQEADKTTRLQKQLAEFNMRAQSWVPCDLEIYLIGQYAASGLDPSQVVLKTKQLLYLLLNSEIAQPGSLRNPRVQLAIEKTLKTKQPPDKEF